ncbi:asparagine synthase (glutamine-hydrolyzing) [Candidatus Roizmanbacteria bacterium CG09_land_8_20_14_0_10_41_9]|uniref:asparagine synthase (glutamine-hydrolyzing) n=1 Tax=Candidatus Roizmanbacteria bacterium CG09_land_8_20_14_0_10_41_9 TaxID=1974850 RepID=A0A2H0WUY0_9BACT|nr:MAG: asparagine synthase (glutamine-hydrolyzing) [Candidatus Roizmanbacteria bacterium CG09_land_8_20_14_0_10_41_9]
MCGIAGFYGFRDDNLIREVSQQLIHRGPDGEGFYIDDVVSLLNRRLAIIDITGGDQPIYNEDKSIVVVYNGEIYNYQFLRRELESSGHKFSTHSDTEVIVHGYEEWGNQCFNKFNGMFAIALYDKKRSILILARDHFGIKPLYYAKLSKDSLFFSSEIKPIIYSRLVKREPNDRIIYRYLRYRIHDDQEETFFKNIYRLMPGQQMILKKDRFKSSYFSTLEKEAMKKSNTWSEDTVQKKIIGSIQSRLVSEVPVGTCLSGGLDSSTVVAVTNTLLTRDVKEAASLGSRQNTFSAVFPGSSNNEESYIDELIKKNPRIQSHKIFPKPETFFKELYDFVKTQEEPTISTGPYAQYKVMEEARKHVTVLLDGQGADEMLAGYTPYYIVYFNELLSQKKYGTLIREITCSLDTLYKLYINKLKALVGLKKDINPATVLNSSFAQEHVSEKFTMIHDNLKLRLKEDIFHNSLPSLLRYEDRNSMKFSVEGRVPFLDINLYRYFFSLDSSAIIKNGWNKYVLRRSMRDMLPRMIVQRKNKIGFTTPEYEWFMRMKNRIYGVFMSESFGKRKYFDSQAIVKSFREFIEGKTDDTMLFWRCLNLEIWLRIFFDGLKEKKKPVKTDFEPNVGKKLKVAVTGKTYVRYPIRTDIFSKGDDYAQKISVHVEEFLQTLKRSTDFRALKNKKWFLVVSEKIIAIAQGRSYPIGDIKTGFFANVLSRFVRRTPYGIGLGSPWTMQLAIQEAGLARILIASVASLVAKPFGVKGIFYTIAGKDIAAIDGPTEYSIYPSNVSAKLAPKDPQDAAKKIETKIDVGVCIIDANDLGQTILGNTTRIENDTIKKIFSDNPMGQADEQTPIVIVFET